MSTDRIHVLIDDFAAQIRAEVQRQAVAALSGHFDQTAPHSNGHSNGSNGKRVAKIAKPAGKGAKRDPALLDKLQNELLAFVVKNPGLRIEQINKQLGTTTKDLALPIRKLIASKAISTRGEKRSTSYFSGNAKKTVANKVVKRKSSAKRSGKAKRSKSAAKPAAAAAASA